MYPTKPYIVSRPNLMPKGDEEGLVDAWNLGNVVNNTVIGVKGRIGTIAGATIGSTPLGKGLIFDGVNDNVDCGADLLGTGAITIEGWIRRDAGAVVFGRLIDNGNTMLYEDSGNFYYRFSSNAGVNVAISAIGSWAVGRVVHIAVTRTAAGVANIYINGQLSGAADQNSGVPVAAATNMYIGNRAVPDRPWTGPMLLLDIYNRILTDQEIRNNYLRAKTALWRTEYGVAVSSADEGGQIGQFISGTPFQCGDAVVRARVETDNINGVSNCKIVRNYTGLGTLYMPTSIMQQNPTEAAFGAWEWWVYVVPTSYAGSMIIGSYPGAITNAAQNGYWAIFQGPAANLRFYSVTAGVATSLFISTGIYPSNMWHKIRITRTSTGVFTFFVDDALCGVSSGTNPLTDVTYNLSSYFTLQGTDVVGSRWGYSCPSGGRAIIKRVIAT